MEFALSESDLLIQESAQRLLEAVSTLERVEQVAQHRSASLSDDVWSGIVDLGIPGMLIPEEHGGLGLSQLEAALVAEMLGRYVAPVPFLASVAMAPIALIECGGRALCQAWLPKMAAGELKVGVALCEHAAGSRDDVQVHSSRNRLSGRSMFVLDFSADAFVVADRSGKLFWVDGASPGLTRRALSTIDATRSVGELVFDHVEAEPLVEGQHQAVLRRMVDIGRTVLAADTLGAAQAMIEKAVAYAKEREQFGRPIGSFQAVKHMCAEMAAELEPARALVWYAGFALDHRKDEASLMAAHAKAHLGDVGTLVARTAVEVHGGVGFTDLLGLHYWFKRIGLNSQLLGGPRRVREDAARLQTLT